MSQLAAHERRHLGDKFEAHAVLLSPGPTQAEDGDLFALPCHFPAKALSRENNFPARRCRKDDEWTGKYQIGMCFLATGRIGSPAGSDFFPIFPCPAGKARGKARRCMPNPRHPVEAEEMWTFVRRRGGQWLLSAIQQI